MPQRPVGVTDEASGATVAQFRTRERTVGADTVVEQYLLAAGERVVSSRLGASTFRTVGVGVANWNMASLFNLATSGVLVAVRRLTVQQDQAGNTGTMRLIHATTLRTAPTTGTLLTPVPFDTAQAASGDVEFRGATASDGGAATTLTATPGTRNAATFAVRLPSGVRRIVMRDMALEGLTDDAIILRPGEGLLVTQIEAPSTSSHYIVSVVWDEFQYP